MVCIFLGFAHHSAVMPQREEIAMKLNSVGLDANDTFRDALTDYFGESDDSDSESETDSPVSSEGIESVPERKESPQQCDKSDSAVLDRPIFYCRYADDSGSQQVPRRS